MDSNYGRFISRDPMGIWGDPVNIGNPYTYCGNNPVNMSDPSGSRTLFGWHIPGTSHETDDYEDLAYVAGQGFQDFTRGVGDFFTLGKASEWRTGIYGAESAAVHYKGAYYGGVATGAVMGAYMGYSAVGSLRVAGVIGNASRFGMGIGAMTGGYSGYNSARGRNAGMGETIASTVFGAGIGGLIGGFSPFGTAGTYGGRAAIGLLGRGLGSKILAGQIGTIAGTTLTGTTVGFLGGVAGEFSSQSVSMKGINWRQVRMSGYRGGAAGAVAGGIYGTGLIASGYANFVRAGAHSGVWQVGAFSSSGIAYTPVGSLGLSNIDKASVLAGGAIDYWLNR